MTCIDFLCAAYLLQIAERLVKLEWYDQQTAKDLVQVDDELKVRSARHYHCTLVRFVAGGNKTMVGDAHVDEADHDGPGDIIVVVGVSGPRGYICWEEPDDTDDKYVMEVSRGEMYAFKGAVRLHWLHEVHCEPEFNDKRETDNERIILVFRIGLMRKVYMHACTNDMTIINYYHACTYQL